MSDSSDENQLDEQEGSDSQVSADDSGLSIFGGRSQLPVRVPGYVVSHTKISAGGYGTVFRARSIESNLLDAVKILTRPHVDDEDRARFLQEIRLAHGLSHRNLIVFRGDGFCQEGRYEGCPYYTMEYMDVGSFKHWLELLDISTAEGLRSAVLIRV